MNRLDVCHMMEYADMKPMLHNVIMLYQLTVIASEQNTMNIRTGIDLQQFFFGNPTCSHVMNNLVFLTRNLQSAVLRHKQHTCRIKSNNSPNLSLLLAREV